MFLKNVPIKRKLMTMLLLTSGIVVLLTCAAFFTYEFVTFRRDTITRLSTLGIIIADNSTAALTFDNPEDASEILRALQAEPHIVAAVLYDKHGQLFSKYPENLPADKYPTSPGAEGYLFKGSRLEGFQAVQQGSRHMGMLYLQSDLTAIYERFELYGGLVLLVLLASFVVAYLLSNALQKQISKPILVLAETARAISQRKDYSVRAVKTGTDEVGLFTDAFNQMLSQIHEQDRGLRESEERFRLLNIDLEQRVVERTAELEAANKELEAFSYSVSHDLRTPLRAIDGFGQILLEDCGKELNEEGSDSLRRIREATQHMGRLIDDLIQLAHVSRSELQKKPTSLTSIAQSVVDMLRQGDSKRAIEIDIEENMVAIADQRLVRVVLENLIGNAWKYSSRNENATIHMGIIHSAAVPVFFIQDNGAGFDMKYYSKLFGAFQRLHEANEFHGTGIGLATVHRIISRHGGQVWAEGKVDEGAVFYFTLESTNEPLSIAGGVYASQEHTVS